MTKPITKTQKEYLETRLRQKRTEKMNQWYEDNQEYSVTALVKEAFEKGELKLAKEIEHTFYSSPYMDKVFDISKYVNISNEKNKELKKFIEGLDKKIKEIMDKAILGSEDLTKILEEF